MSGREQVKTTCVRKAIKARGKATAGDKEQHEEDGKPNAAGATAHTSHPNSITIVYLTKQARTVSIQKAVERSASDSR